MQTETEPARSKQLPVVDAHTHIFCWGENPKEGFLSEQTRRSRITRLLLRLTGITREPGATRVRDRVLEEELSVGSDAVELLGAAVPRREARRHDY